MWGWGMKNKERIILTPFAQVSASKGGHSTGLHTHWVHPELKESVYTNKLDHMPSIHIYLKKHGSIS
jgi:hypothetical protein